MEKREQVAPMSDFNAPGVLTAEAREELWNNSQRSYGNGNGNGKSNGHSNGHANGHTNGEAKRGEFRFDDTDEDIHLEIGELGGFY